MQEIEMGTLYQVNKNLLMTEKAMTRDALRQAYKKIKKFFIETKDQYFMLLCREQYDFTLFNFTNKENIKIKDLEECLTNRGEVICIDLTENKDAFEIWLNIHDEPFAYYLFPYDLGVIET